MRHANLAQGFVGRERGCVFSFARVANQKPGILWLAERGFLLKNDQYYAIAQNKCLATGKNIFV